MGYYDFRIEEMGDRAIRTWEDGPSLDKRSQGDEMICNILDQKRKHC